MRLGYQVKMTFCNFGTPQDVEREKKYTRAGNRTGDLLVIHSFFTFFTAEQQRFNFPRKSCLKVEDNHCICGPYYKSFTIVIYCHRVCLIYECNLRSQLGLSQQVHRFTVQAAVIVIVNYDHKTFIVQPAYDSWGLHHKTNCNHN